MEHDWDTGYVSIRSPHGCKGRLRERAPRTSIPEQFQSAPLTDVRGDISCAWRCTGTCLMFQSAPLTDVRGDTRVVKKWKITDIVSIRSPHGCKGRLISPCGYPSRARFQSAPLTDVRGDGKRPRGRAIPLHVSIRSPHGCKGRCIESREAFLGQKFQSAPLTDVRGD